MAERKQIKDQNPMSRKRMNNFTTRYLAKRHNAALSSEQ